MKRAGLCKGGGAILFAPKPRASKRRPKTMKPNSNNCVCPRQSAAGGIRLQRNYPSSAAGRTCVVSDSGGHQSASGGPAGESTGEFPNRSDRPSTLSPKPSVSYVLFVPFLTKTTQPARRRYCSSCTFPLGIAMKPDSIKPGSPQAVSRRRSSTGGPLAVCKQSAAGRIRLQRIYPSSAPRPTCVVSDSGGHQSASGGPAGESASGSPARHPPSILPFFSLLSSHFSPPPIPVADIVHLIHFHQA